jgi:hypothetical protein
MQLIGVLAAGVAGAASGHAEIYVRRTTTRATYYTSAEGTDTTGQSTAISTGANVDLDSNGGASVYVNQSVDVVVKDSDGATVRSFTEMEASPNVEARTASMLGTHYTTGASAASNPVTLQEVLDRVITSFGSTNWNVLYNGSASTLQSALTDIAGVWFNVKTYGATGDGSTDDSTAIQAAIDAAELIYSSTGKVGVVFFPSGIYKTTVALTATNSVILCGTPTVTSTILLDHASNNAVTITSPGAQLINIQIKHNQANSGDIITLGASAAFYARRLAIAPHSGSTGHLIKTGGASCNIVIDDCQFVSYATASEMVDASATLPAQLSITHTVFTHAATAPSTACVISPLLVMHACKFSSAATSGTLNYVEADDISGAQALDILFTNNRFDAGSGGTVNMLDITNNFDASDHIFEDNNRIKCSYFGASGSETFEAGSENCYHHFGSVKGRIYRVATDATPVALPDGYGLYVIDKTSNSDFAVSGPTAWVVGQRFTLIISAEGGAITNITAYGIGYDDLGGATYDLGNLQIASHSYVAANIGGTLAWCLDGASTEDMT